MYCCGCCPYLVQGCVSKCRRAEKEPCTSCVYCDNAATKLQHCHSSVLDLTLYWHATSLPTMAAAKLGKVKVNEEWIKKEFLSTMQAKGKLPRYTTEAGERRVSSPLSPILFSPTLSTSRCLCLSLPATHIWWTTLSVQDKAYYETTDRIFPGPGGKDTMLQIMLDRSEQRISEGKEAMAKNATSAEAAGAAVNTYRERRAAHKGLKVCSRRTFPLSHHYCCSRHTHTHRSHHLILHQLAHAAHAGPLSLSRGGLCTPCLALLTGQAQVPGAAGAD